jgi:hypothetical protein
MTDTHTLMVGIFVTCWMLLFFGGSAIGLRKAYDKPASTAKDTANEPR